MIQIMVFVLLLSAVVVVGAENEAPTSGGQVVITNAERAAWDEVEARGFGPAIGAVKPEPEFSLSIPGQIGWSERWGGCDDQGVSDRAQEETDDDTIQDQ